MTSSILNPVSFLRQFGFLQSDNWSLSSCPPLTDRVALITGGQGGIGAEITKQLLLHDISQVIVLARNRERFDRARDEIWIPALENSGKGRGRVERVRFMECDLMDLRVVERVGRELAGPGPEGLKRLDMLFLNAAIPMLPTYNLSPQGIETMFATNHLGHFHLTQILLPLLTSTPQAHSVSSTRIIVTSSSLHNICREISFDSLSSPTRTTSFGSSYDSVYRYARSKLANILFTRSLSKHLPEDVFANVYFPGNIPTEAMDTWKSLVGPLGGAVSGLFQRIGQSLEDGAATGLFLATSEDVEKNGYRGEYWVPIAKKEKCSSLALDVELAEKLWSWSREFIEKALHGETVAVEGGLNSVHVQLAHPECLAAGILETRDIAVKIRPWVQTSNITQYLNPRFAQLAMANNPTYTGAMGNGIPQLSSDDLNIESWERMDHGGHSFVFKVLINGEISVIKIFRFQTRVPPTSSNTRLRPSPKPPTERPEPYIYYRRESTSYGLLCAAQLTGSLTPRIHGVLCISPAHETYLLSEGKLKGLSRRKRKDTVDKPLMAVWIEYIGGRRLAMQDMLGGNGNELKREVESALQKIHDAGVVQGDVKWRNIMVLDNDESNNDNKEVAGGGGGGGGERRIVWLDFSNAVIQDNIEKALWDLKVNEEMQRLRDMLSRHELLNSKLSGPTGELASRKQVALGDSGCEFVPERVESVSSSTAHSV